MSRDHENSAGGLSAHHAATALPCAESTKSGTGVGCASLPSAEPAQASPSARALRTFTVYRRNVPAETHDANQTNAPDEPQFEGVLFSDGYVAVRWLTAARSVSVWTSLSDLMKIHGHPEYGSVWVWHDTEAFLQTNRQEAARAALERAAQLMEHHAELNSNVAAERRESDWEMASTHKSMSHTYSHAAGHIRNLPLEKE